MTEPLFMVGAAEAWAHITEHIPQLPAERVPLLSALGSVLAEDVIAPLSFPPWANSSMDGYAVRSADIPSAPTTLRVTGEVPAGAVPLRPIERGEAVKVMTGAPVPIGADTVVRVEDTDGGTSTVQIRSLRDIRKNIRPAGEDYHRGDVLGRAGDAITPAMIGVLASAGARTVITYRKPTVGIVSSGDELVMLDAFDSVLASKRIVSSNSYSLPAMVREAGGLPRDMGIAGDDPHELRARIESALGCDLLVTTGGVSVGDRDYTREVLRAMGADVKFWRVRIRPGGPLAFGIVDGHPWFGLAGNPVSAMVTFALYVRPAILSMSGHTRVFPHTFRVILDEPLTVSGDLTHYLRIIVTYDEHDRAHARLTGTQSSGALTSMMKAHALLVVPEGQQHYDAGETLRAVRIGSSQLDTAVFPG